VAGAEGGLLQQSPADGSLGDEGVVAGAGGSEAFGIVLSITRIGYRKSGVAASWIPWSADADLGVPTLYGVHALACLV
jgi:hypothetical protein